MPSHPHLFAPAKAAPLAVEISEAQLWAAVFAVVGSLAGVVVWGVKGWMKERDDRYLELKNRYETLEKVAEGSLSTAEQVVHRALRDRGIEPIPPVAAVVPKTNSPVTEIEIVDARLATFRAREAAALLKAQIAMPGLIEPLKPVTAAEVEAGPRKPDPKDPTPKDPKPLEIQSGNLRVDGNIVNEEGVQPVTMTGTIKKNETTP